MIVVMLLVFVMASYYVGTCFVLRDLATHPTAAGDEARSLGTVDPPEALDQAMRTRPLWTSRDDRQLTRLLKTSSR